MRRTEMTRTPLHDKKIPNSKFIGTINKCDLHLLPDEASIHVQHSARDMNHSVIPLRGLLKPGNLPASIPAEARYRILKDQREMHHMILRFLVTNGIQVSLDELTGG